VRWPETSSRCAVECLATRRRHSVVDTTGPGRCAGLHSRTVQSNEYLIVQRCRLHNLSAVEAGARIAPRPVFYRRQAVLATDADGLSDHRCN
jgi:hypothetical protein